MQTKRLSSWWVPDIEPFKAPEQKHMYLIGYLDTGVRIITSSIISTTGRIVRTESGSLYELCNPDQEYLNWMKEKNISFDPENPVKIYIK